MSQTSVGSLWPSDARFYREVADHLIVDVEKTIETAIREGAHENDEELKGVRALIADLRELNASGMHLVDLHMGARYTLAAMGRPWTHGGPPETEHERAAAAMGECGRRDFRDGKQKQVTDKCYIIGYLCEKTGR